jgi:hypothetical protein
MIHKRVIINVTEVFLMGKETRPGFWQVIKSVIAGAIGVQSEENRLRDFQSTSIWPFIIGGIVFTVLFVVVLIVFVNLIA